jgi:hypothetical protein
MKNQTIGIGAKMTTKRRNPPIKGKIKNTKMKEKRKNSIVHIRKTTKTRNGKTNPTTKVNITRKMPLKIIKVLSLTERKEITTKNKTIIILKKIMIIRSSTRITKEEIKLTPKTTRMSKRNIPLKIHNKQSQRKQKSRRPKSLQT